MVSVLLVLSIQIYRRHTEQPEGRANSGVSASEGGLQPSFV